MNEAQEKFLSSPVNELPLTSRTIDCLAYAKVIYVFELIAKTEGEMLRTKNFGRANLQEIKCLLKEYELSLGMKESVAKYIIEAQEKKKAVHD